MTKVSGTGVRLHLAEMHRLHGVVSFDRARRLTRRRQRCDVPLTSRWAKAPNRSKCAPRRAWLVCGRVRAGTATRTTCSRRSMGWFTEGFDTLDLKDAKALLDELHA